MAQTAESDIIRRCPERKEVSSIALACLLSFCPRRHGRNAPTSQMSQVLYNRLLFPYNGCARDPDRETAYALQELSSPSQKQRDKGERLTNISILEAARREK
jgi:hypothetical protein